jgi:hypothetical protein
MGQRSGRNYTTPHEGGVIPDVDVRDKASLETMGFREVADTANVADEIRTLKRRVEAVEKKVGM